MTRSHNRCTACRSSAAPARAVEDGDADRLNRSLTELERNTLHTLREMRLLLYELRPADLEQEGLVRAIELRLDAVERRANLRLEVRLDELAGISPSQEVELYHIVVEALNNVVKHAAATRVVLQLTQADGHLHLRIVDDGQGFDPEQTKGGMGKHPGAGSPARRPAYYFQRAGRRHAVGGGDSLPKGGRPMSELIRVLIADDHFVVRQGLAALLVPRNGMEVVGEAATGREAVALARTLQPDVILMDMIMPEMDGPEAITFIKQENPKARILVLTVRRRQANLDSHSSRRAGLSVKTPRPMTCCMPFAACTGVTSSCPGPGPETDAAPTCRGRA